jgi:DEAD/DEAH box helicase domain-containing protein
VSYVDALQMVEHVRNRLVDLAVSENHVRDRAVADVFRRVWAEGGSADGLVSELWVEGTLPGEKSPETLSALAERGAFPRDLCARITANGAFPTNAHLYTHQVEAVMAAARAAGQKPALVVAAGTGQGKTEAFLLPLLSDLWSASARRSNGGMRTLILYPLNALVADQIERIYGWLKGQDRLTVFHFTSETLEDARRANRQGEPAWEPCRMRTRQEARGRETHDGRPIPAAPFGSVPDIVITNYSMLEYMLCRPQDSCFFGPDLRCIVLDEAHLYTGALAAEIAMLLRRVRQRCGVSPQDILQIATSATLGGTDEELRKFASVLFSTNERTTHVFRGRPGRPDLGDSVAPPVREPEAEALAKFSQTELTTLTSDGSIVEDASAETMASLRGIVSHLVAADSVAAAVTVDSTTPARLLHRTLRQAPLVRRLAETLLTGSGRVINVDALAGHLFPGTQGLEARAATILLLRLSAAARDTAGEMPLVPHRLHFLVRAPDGLSVCLNDGCSGPLATRLDGLGCIQSTADKCRYCQHITLPVHRCQNCGEWAMAGHESQELPLLEPAYYSTSTSQQTFYLLNHPNEPQSDGLLAGKETVIDTKTGERKGHGAPGKLLWKAPTLRAKPGVQCCPTCVSEWAPLSDEDVPYTRQTCGPLVGGRLFALSVVAETVLHDLPPYQDNSREWKPAQGRRLLCFSDSRRAAARLGPLLTRQHEIALVRAAIARTALEHSSQEVIQDVEEDIKRLESRLREAGPAADKVRVDRLRRELAEKQSELLRASVGVPFDQFARLFAQRPEVRQILDRDGGDRHLANTYCQMDWESNVRAVQKHAEALVATELDRPIKQRVHVEATGLAEVVYPGIDDLTLPFRIEAELRDEGIRAALRDNWTAFVHLLLDSLRFDNLVGWSTADDDPSRCWMGKSPLTGRWAVRSATGRPWRAHAFVGATVRQQRRAFATNVLRAAGCTASDAERLSAVVLEAVFDQIYDAPPLRAWLRVEANHQVNEHSTDKAIRMALDRLSVRRPTSLFRCPETGTVWTRSALGWTWADGCLGNLTPVSEDDLDNDPRWGRPRRELLESPYFSEGLWGEEHSAQLDPHENRRLQELFKHGVRNILSSTTTMELGVDIGGLNGVLLGNVPPGPANHRQRAGRAGRRSDGSAVVVTYARDSEYDREVFRRYEVFLTRELRKPTVFLNRTRIVQRHLQAVLLSEFLRPTQPGHTGAMEAFGHMGAFCGVTTVPGWWRRDAKPMWNPPSSGTADLFSTFLGSLESNPAGIDSRLAALAEGTPFGQMMTPASWSAFVAAARGVFDEALKAWREELAQLRDAWNDIPANPTQQVSLEMAKANSIAYQVRLICDITVIEWLADHQFLPRYGFPVNVQQLTVRSPEEEQGQAHTGPDERYKLERGSLLALSEYVPGSRVLVGGRVAHSRGISKHWTDANRDKALGLEELAITCTQGHVFLNRSVDALCPTCGCQRATFERLLFPRFGYTTAAWEPMEREISFERVGESKTYPTAFAEVDSAEDLRNDFGGIPGLVVKYREGAQLLIRNAGEHSCGFALCTRCGYAESEEQPGQDGVVHLPKDFERHASVLSTDPDKPCWPRRGAGQPAVLRNRVIAAREPTDMLLLEWPGATASGLKGAFSLGRALVLAGTRLLELDHRELAMVPLPLAYPQLGIVIYDTAPGGSGHCAELLERGLDWIGATRDVLYVNEEHDRQCERACLNCILDFSGQHAAHKLDRRAALTLLEGRLPAA